MDSRASTFDDYRKQLQMVLEDPSESPVPVSLDFLKDITDGFSSDRLIGRGGFGEVYRGILGRGKFIAIKKLYAEHVVTDHKYQAELDSLLRIRHQNIVLLIGYCSETKLQVVSRNGEHIMAEVRERLLCFEYIGNGSLRDYVPDLHIFKKEDDQDLPGWDKRYAIMEGICRGLDFLHEECKLTHMDLKPENILLDGNMVPKITDFGLSRLKDAEKSQIVTQTLTGTLGYMPPEYLLQGQISHQTDIYSLGVIMCEIITGEKMPFVWSSATSRKFTERACRRWMEIFDKSLNDASLKETYIKQVKQLLDIALNCVDHDRMKRPSSSKILEAVFNQNPSSLCELNSNYGQVSELLTVHPLQLDFSSPDTKEPNCSSCSLHLTNNMDIPVAFRLLPSSETLSAHYFWLRSGVVPPKCRYTLAVIMRPQRNPTFGNDDFFTLESTKARVVHGLRFVNDPEEIFKRATERSFKVHEVKLAFVCARTELPIGPDLKPELTQRVSWDGQDMKPGLVVIPGNRDDNHRILNHLEMCVVHPTEPWIFRKEDPYEYKFVVWNYNRLEVVQFHLAKKEQRLNWRITDDNTSPYYVDGLFLPGRPKFVSQKRWILVGLEDRNYYRQEVGYIYVYNYIAVQNFKGSKTYLVSKIKSFKAHDNGSVFLDVHPSRPYVLSLSVISDGYDSGKLKPVGKSIIKLWDWENGWDCVKTFNMEEAVTGGAQFNPKDQDTFGTISKNGVVKVWNIDSPECTYTFTTTGARCFDFFSTQGGKQYLVIAEDGKYTIWDYNSGTLVETLKGNMGTVYSHPELPVLITGSDGSSRSGVAAGSVLLWSSSTFRFLWAY
ncbi:hypothetical protein PVAP13_2KG118348 [Panicum virgatum]|uniref:Protein kinase domain-containing protein n=1 Tax=Panicum virgatum TaxID=38727 RepID=A0A8T0W0H6_PANVG|nr:hypothetical protein PVAP13_2KG118348 [Panicum virgatum]KAG2640784.1 hypothetical protein PVAP13_2KG118348 [Panicum virgatum]